MLSWFLLFAVAVGGFLTPGPGLRERNARAFAGPSGFRRRALDLVCRSHCFW